jgi:hypothetical protein
MVADEVELVAIEAGPRGGVQALAQLTVEDQVAKTLAGDQIVEACRQSHAKEWCGGERICAAMFQDARGCHGCSFGRVELQGHF